MQAEIAAIGNELLLGMTANTNALFLSRRLTDLGFSVSRHTVLSDEPKAIREGIREALARVPLVIATGGLGPTIDDLTRDAVKGLFSGAPRLLKNPVGTARGEFHFSEGKGLVLLPGPPREMEEMFLREAVPLIQSHFAPKRQHIHSFSLCLFMEKEIDPFLRDLAKEHPEIESGIYPSQGTLQIVLKSDRPLEDAAKKFEEKFPTFVFHDRSIEEALHRILIEKKLTLGLAESCTGGAIAARLTAIPDASYFLLGSIVAYSNAWKERFLGVSSDTLSRQGAVSEETVAKMLDGIFENSGADCAIAVSGIAGPSGGTPEKPVGTIYIGVGKRGERHDVGVVHASSSDRMSAIDFAVRISLSALWRRIIYKAVTFT